MNVEAVFKCNKLYLQKRIKWHMQKNKKMGLLKLDLQNYDRWLEKHFEMLVTEYAGKAIAIVGDKIIAVGDNEREVDQKARNKYPKESPFVFTVPSEEDFVCLL